MSTVHEEDNFDKLVRDLDIDAQTKIEKDSMLDLSSFGQMQINNLAAFKAHRLQMITKREALKKAIKIMDKRIEIALAAIKVLQTPN